MRMRCYQTHCYRYTDRFFFFFAPSGALGGHHAGPLLTDRSAASTTITAATAVSSFTEKSSALAHSVYDGVKTKMRELRAQLSAKDMQVRGVARVWGGGR